MTFVRTTREIAAALTGPLMHGEQGATVSVVRGVAVPTVGYVVALKGHGIVVPTGRLDGDTVTAWVARVRTVASLPGRYVGVWDDGAGRVYLDVVEIISARADALARGRERGEIAIFDLATGDEIRCDSDETDARDAYATLADLATVPTVTDDDVERVVRATGIGPVATREILTAYLAR